MKRLLDILLSAIALTALAPIFIIIGIAIKLDSKGPIFFKQGRLTINGRVFSMYKFRTMVENAENMGTGLFNFKDDFRVTKVGGILRRTSLDELPQIFNVLNGGMSLVGPRPPVSYELGNYEDLNAEWKRRFTVLPGITGLAQVSGRNELPWSKKIKYDNQYIDLFNKYGILIDIKIIFQTFSQIFSTKEIYEVKDEALDACTDEEIAQKAKDGLVVPRKDKVEGKNNI